MQHVYVPLLKYQCIDALHLIIKVILSLKCCRQCCCYVLIFMGQSNVGGTIHTDGRVEAWQENVNDANV